MVSGCAAMPGLPSVVHDTRLGIVQADLAAVLVAFGETCQDRPTALLRTRAVRFTTSTSGKLPSSAVLEHGDSVDPFAAGVSVGSINVALDQDLIAPDEVMRVFQSIRDLCARVERGPSLSAERTGIAARSASGEWYGAELKVVGTISKAAEAARPRRITDDVARQRVD